MPNVEQPERSPSERRDSYPYGTARARCESRESQREVACAAVALGGCRRGLRLLLQVVYATVVAGRHPRIP